MVLILCMFRLCILQLSHVAYIYIPLHSYYSVLKCIHVSMHIYSCTYAHMALLRGLISPVLAGKDMSVADNYVGGTYLIYWKYYI